MDVERSKSRSRSRIPYQIITFLGGLAHPTPPRPPHPPPCGSRRLCASGGYLGRGGWSLGASESRCAHQGARRFFVFETVKTFAILGIASIANDYQTACQKKNRLLFVGFTHTQPGWFCSASGFVSICVASWKLIGLLSVFTLMRPINLLGAGSGARSRAGRCAEPFWVRDFSGLGTWSPAIIFIAGDHALF